MSVVDAINILGKAISCKVPNIVLVYESEVFME